MGRLLAIAIISVAALVYADVTASTSSGFDLFVVGLMVLLTPLLSVAVHELSHVLAAVAWNLPVHAVAVGSAMVVREDGKTHITWAPPRNELNGFVVVDYWSKPASKLAPALGAMAIAGPIGNLIAAATAEIALLTFSPTTWIVRTGLGLFVLINLYFAAFNLYPRQFGVLRTDGSLYLVCRTGGLAADRVINTARLGSMPAFAERPRNWQPLFVALAEGAYQLGPTAPEIEQMSWWLSIGPTYYLRMDQGDVAGAKAVLDLADQRRHMTDRHVAAIVAEIDVLRAIHLALWEQNAMQAERRLALIPGQNRGYALCRGAEAAIHLSYGEHLSAREKALAALDTLPRTEQRTGFQQVEADWWQFIVETARASIAQGQSTIAPDAHVATDMPHVAVAAG